MLLQLAAERLKLCEASGTADACLGEVERVDAAVDGDDGDEGCNAAVTAKQA